MESISHIHDYDGLIFRFCLIDDFCQVFIPWFEQKLLSLGNIHRLRTPNLSLSEIMTLMVEFQYSNYRDFKAFFMEYVQVFLKPLFPGLGSYNRFVELMSRALIPLMSFLQTLMGECSGISFLDSTVMRVCHIKRIFNNKTFYGKARRGKSTMGWFYGFKLHLTVSETGELLSWILTPGNVDDRTPAPSLAKNLWGKIFADKGYISNTLFLELYEKGVHLVTGIRSNMKNKLMELMDKIYLRKRSIIETINDHLKNECHIDHTRHRSPVNFLVNLISGLIAYQLEPKKPHINFTGSELRLIPSETF
jgi:hypothetical protein